MDQQPTPKISKPTPPFKILLMVVGIIIILSLVFLAGYSLGSQSRLGPGLGLDLGLGKSSYEAGWQAAKEKMEQSGLLRPEPAEIFTLSGTITAVAKNQITLKSDPTVINPLTEQAPEIRTVAVTSETKILKLTPKTPEEVAREAADFRKAMSAFEPGAAPPTPPSPYAEEELKISDLKTGDIISVTSETNIKMATQFEAKEIRITSTPETTRPASPTLP